MDGRVTPLPHRHGLPPPEPSTLSVSSVASPHCCPLRHIGAISVLCRGFLSREKKRPWTGRKTGRRRSEGANSVDRAGRL